MFFCKNVTVTLFKVAFFSATANAFSETSTAKTAEFKMFFANEIAIQPLPVPISNIFKSFFLDNLVFNFTIQSTNSSVSGLGINTFSSTINSEP